MVTQQSKQSSKGSKDLQESGKALGDTDGTIRRFCSTTRTKVFKNLDTRITYMHLKRKNNLSGLILSTTMSFYQYIGAHTKSKVDHKTQVGFIPRWVAFQDIIGAEAA